MQFKSIRKDRKYFRKPTHFANHSLYLRVAKVRTLPRIAKKQSALRSENLLTANYA